MRATLGGERPSDLARELGYGGGSGVAMVVRRLDARARDDQGLAARLTALRKAFTGTAETAPREE